MRLRGPFALCCAVALFAPTVARADFLVTSDPDAAYLAATTRLDVPANPADTLSSLSDGALTVGFSTEMMILDVPDGWSTWSSPPQSESATPLVLWTQGPSQVTLSFSSGLSTFGFEAQPDAFGVIAISATFFSGADEVGTIVRDVNGNGGALLFAATVTDPTGLITSVTISTGGQDFGIAQLRYVLGATAIPEPASVLLMATGAIGVVLARRGLRRRGA